MIPKIRSLGIIALFSILFIAALPNMSNATNSPPDSLKTELTKEKIYSDVKSALSQLGGALKVGAEHVYEVLVKQQIVSAVTWLIVDIIFISASIILWSMFRIYYRKYEETNKSDDEESMGGYGITSTIVSIITIVVLLCSLSSITTGFINPEYGAIKDILEVIK